MEMFGQPTRRMSNLLPFDTHENIRPVGISVWVDILVCDKIYVCFLFLSANILTPANLLIN